VSDNRERGYRRPESRHFGFSTGFQKTYLLSRKIYRRKTIDDQRSDERPARNPEAVG